MALNLSALTGKTQTTGASTSGLNTSAFGGPVMKVSPAPAPLTFAPLSFPESTKAPASNFKLVNTPNSNSTIAFTPPGEPVKDIPVRLPFGTKDQTISVKALPGPLNILSQTAAMLANLINRTIEIPAKATAQLGQNLESIKSFKEGRVEVPATEKTLAYNPERLGFEEKIISTQKRTNDMYEATISSGEVAPKWLQTIAPSFKDPVAWASYKAVLFNVVPDVADLFVAGDIIAGGVKEAIRATAPDVERLIAWNKLGQPKTIEEANLRLRDIQKEFHPDRPGGDIKVSTDANNAYSVLKTKGIPTQGAEETLNKVLRVLDTDIEKLATGQIRPVGEVPRIDIRGLLPGTAEEAGQGPALGLSTRRVKKVGGVPEEPIIPTNVGAEQTRANIETNAKQLGLSVEDYLKKNPSEVVPSPKVAGLFDNAPKISNSEIKFAPTAEQAIADLKQKESPSTNTFSRALFEERSQEFGDPIPSEEVQLKAEKDWEDNYAERVSKIIKESDDLIKERKVAMRAKDTQLANDITAKLYQIESKASELEAEFIQKYNPGVIDFKPRVDANDPVAIAEKYWNEVVSKKINKGEATIIGSDELKDFFGDYATENHQKYSLATRELYYRSVAESKNPVVKFTAGGPGAGKTDFIVTDIAEGFNGVIYDSTASDYETVLDRINFAESQGKKVEVYGVIPDLADARFYTMKRAEETGRAIPLDVFAKTHSGAIDSMIKLIKDGESVKILDIRGITSPDKVVFEDNPLQKLQEAYKTPDEIKKIVEGITHENRQPTKAESKSESVSLPIGGQPDTKGGAITGESSGPALRSEATAEELKFNSEELKDAIEESLQFANKAIESQYGKFVRLVKDLKLRDGFAREVINSTDIDGIANLLKERGKWNQKTQDIFYSQEYSSNELLDMFRNRLEQTRPELLYGKKTAENLELQNVVAENEMIKEAVASEQSDLKALIDLRTEKELSINTFSRIRKAMDIGPLKKASPDEIWRLTDFIETLDKGDKMLTDLQQISLKEIVNPEKDFNKPMNLVTQREVTNKYKEAKEIMAGSVTKYIENNLFPSVDIKEGHPLITKIVNKADEVLTVAEKETERRNEAFNEMLTKAEKSRTSRLTPAEATKRKLVPQNKEIFQAMGGEVVDLTKEEAAVVAYLRNFFNKVRNDLELEKWRKYYITHMEKPLLEKIASEGLIPAVSDIFNLRKAKDLNLPIDIMLELDNIIGSEKFFKFSLPRSGPGKPTTNLRRIINDYGRLYETKKALDTILPEGQAVVQLLLQPKSAVWTKKFLQNLKGRGLDTNFRTGKMGWLTRVADGIIDAQYLYLLGANVWSPLKNLAAGEANSFIYQDLRKYLTGKARMVQNPKKLFKMAIDSGVLDGTFADYSQRGIGSLKKLQDLAMSGQKYGEYEIRGSLFASELTPAEWSLGKISPERVRSIKDVVAITQGIFSKTDSPLWVQTWYGRLFLQMNRWRITNGLMIRRLTVEAAKEIKAGKPGQGTYRLSKAFILYGIGMYLAYEAGKAGNKRFQQVAKSMGETINSVVDTLTLKPIVDMFTNNPTYSVLKQLAFSIQELAAYIGVPGVVEPKKVIFQSGLEDSVPPAINQLKELMGSTDSGKSGGLKVKVPSVNIPKIKIPGIKI